MPREPALTRDLLSLVTALLLAAACRGSTPKVPVTPASITGRITAIQRSGERIGTVRVEERETDVAGSAKAVVRVTQRTTVVGVPPTASADFNALRVGQWVRAWFVGPVRESYPVQAEAGTIVIDSLESGR